jgi:trans-2,3-dihydro-3-hydroxyanthranilate isomerase
MTVTIFLPLRDGLSVKSLERNYLMRYRYYLCDIFTDTRFGGNQLAILPNASGLTDEQMQKIAREFNLTQTTFVFPSQAGYTRKVRIFTTTTEVPFAGHPNIGTAFALATTGEFGEIKSTIQVYFEEEAGLVPISISKSPGYPLVCRLAAPEKLSFGATASSQLVAEAVSLNPSDIITDTHPPCVASVGLPFLFVELKNRDALLRAGIDLKKLFTLVAKDLATNIQLYIRSNDDFDIRARVFAPLEGVPEDPATGSANCALAGILSHHKDASDGLFKWRIAQGVEMGRPSVLNAEAEKKNGVVVRTTISGTSVMVAEGFIEVD